MKRLISLLILIAAVAVSATAARPIAKHVVLIGLDGWGAYSYENADMPNVKRLAAEGAYTLTKRSVLPSSSAVNWASMFMGAGPEIHGYTEWGSKTPELPSRELSHYGIFPSIWGLFRDAYPNAEMGYIYEWEGMQYFVEMSAFNFTKQVSASEENPRGITDAAVDYISSSKPAFVGIIYDRPDHEGHTFGHGSPEYYQTLAQLDRYIGEIIKAVDDAGMTENTIFIVTSDHGGIDKGHGGKTMAEMETPFIIAGKGIKSGTVITHSMMQFDVASTLVHIFRISQPQVWIGRPMKQAFK